MVRLRLSLAFFPLAGSFVLAQQLVQSLPSAFSPQAAQIILPLSKATTNCPIGVEANVVGLPALSSAASQKGQTLQHETKPGDQVRLQLNVTNPTTQKMVGATFTVHGFSRKLRTFSLSDSSNAPDLSRTVHVALTVQENDHASSELSLHRFTPVVAYLALDSVQFADGTRWQSSSSGDCTVYPNPVVRIAAVR